jgi:hypothetical protein
LRHQPSQGVRVFYLPKELPRGRPWEIEVYFSLTPPRAGELDAAPLRARSDSNFRFFSYYIFGMSRGNTPATDIIEATVTLLSSARHVACDAGQPSLMERRI